MGVVHLVGSSGSQVRVPSIQAAVDLAADGDTILLSDGVFLGPGNHGVIVEGKNVVLRSRRGPEACIIDCQGSGRGFLFRGPQVTSATLLSGVTIRGGNPANTDEFGSGGAILVKDRSWPTIEACIVVENRGRTGGGIVVHPDTQAPAPAGLTRITDCAVLDNTSWFGGGGGLYAGYAEIERCTVRGNRAQQRGGGIQCFNGVLLRDSLVAENTSIASDGGGVHVSGPGSIAGCTIAGNRALSGKGGGVLAQVSSILCENSVLWGNTAGAGSQLYSQNSVFFAQPTLSYCAVEQGAGGIGADNVMGAPLLTAVLTEDPQFVQSAHGAYRLDPLSPCRDAGDPAFLPLANEGDVDLEPRLNGLVDIGCDEVWIGLALALPAPGRAGAMNELRACGATAGDFVGYFLGAEVGVTSFSFGACPGLTLGIAEAEFLGHEIADEQGQTVLRGLVQPSARGQQLYFQVLSLHPTPPLGCRVSNLVSFEFP